MKLDELVAIDIRTHAEEPCETATEFCAAELRGHRSFFTAYEAMLVAAHNYDLEAARGCGLKTAHVVRANAQDPSKAANVKPLDNWEYVASDLIKLAEILR